MEECQMIIVVDGPRASGKTTFIDAFSEYVKSNYGVNLARMKFDRGEDPWADMKATIEMYGESEDVIVIDRFHITEFAMYHIRHDFIHAVSNDILIKFLEIEALLSQSGAITVYFCPPWNVIKHRMDLLEREDDGSYEHPIWKVVNQLFENSDSNSKIYISGEISRIRFQELSLYVLSVAKAFQVMTILKRKQSENLDKGEEE